jgi:hypothetical protein
VTLFKYAGLAGHLGAFLDNHNPVGYFDGQSVFDGSSWMSLAKFRTKYGEPLSQRKFVHLCMLVLRTSFLIFAVFAVHLSLSVHLCGFLGFKLPTWILVWLCLPFLSQVSLVPKFACVCSTVSYPFWLWS